MTFLGRNDRNLVRQVERFTGNKVSMMEIEGLEPRSHLDRPKRTGVRAQPPKTGVRAQPGRSGKPGSDPSAKQNPWRKSFAR